MVWEWRCHSIVMLTELQEREQVTSSSWGLQAMIDGYKNYHSSATQSVWDGVLYYTIIQIMLVQSLRQNHCGILMCHIMLQFLFNCSVLVGKMLPILAHRGISDLWRLHSRVERRYPVWHIQPTRFGTDICAGKQFNQALSHSLSEYKRQWGLKYTQDL